MVILENKNLCLSKKSKNQIINWTLPKSVCVKPVYKPLNKSKEYNIRRKATIFRFKMATQKKIEKMRISKSQQFLFSTDNSRRLGVSK